MLAVERIGNALTEWNLPDRKELPNDCEGRINLMLSYKPYPTSLKEMEEHVK
jgi:hypothetical protein